MGILRSEPMKHGTLVLPIDRARQFIDLIGANTKMQFEDMNAREMHRPYKKYVQRIDEMERILRFLLDELTKVPGAEVIRNNVDNFLANADDYKLDEVEARLKQIHQDFIQFKENNAKLTGRRNAALEERYVVQTAIASMAQISASTRPSRSLRQEDGDQFQFAASRSLLDDEEGGSSSRTLETMFSNIAGVIPQAEQDRFARTLFRATRGNTFTHFQQIFEPMQDPKTGREVHKSVFVIYFQDSRMGSAISSAMSEKINKICNSYGVNTYRWPTSREAAEEMRLSLEAQVKDQERLLKAHESFVRSEAASLLEPVRNGGDSLIEEWRLFCVKEKSIYAALNLFEGQMNLRANCWYPEEDEDEIRRLLIQQSAGQGGLGHSSAMLVSDRTSPKKNPPTYIRRNELTAPFQDMVDAYAPPSYREVNPALFAVVTFPFLFGVMFGDIGHGLMVLMVGAYAVWKADELKHNHPDLYYARYMLFMMGFFATYSGFLYNDLFSVGLNIFGSRWQAPSNSDQNAKIITFEPMYDTKNGGGLGPYPFGIDPAWHGAQNELVFMNSMKMKMSVIIGIFHMIVGIVLKFANSIHKRNAVDFICECIPMMVFMVCFFGFMDCMILYKWVTPLDPPPSIINSMISMAMWSEDSNPMLGASLPRILMVICILSVPCMLVPKPLIQLMQHKAKMERAARAARGPGGPGAAGHGIGRSMALVDEEAQQQHKEEDEEEFDFSEIMIHQVIWTIEYVLGTVSHTASYLRLWALSLAHQQLSVVFFSMTLLGGMGLSFPLNVISIYFTFAAWFAVSVMVLLGMDTLECFMHTLRLHWIEFQTKFYEGGGYYFVPFCHKTILMHSE
mmetsp:Transcript_32649/g.74017  ORF Transcript_32649/g.74017 Transcript_32649/m.74017 type:complete len:848 (+) Transcript_32649:139-2682(+)